MQDREIVAAIVAGEPGGLAAAYDRYAQPLHAYCCTMLGEPSDAADAVQDTFVIAAAKLGALRDPDRLRPWLYAVARNECHRRLRGRATAAPLHDVDEWVDDAPDIGIAAEQAELRQLVRSALGGLNPGEREIIELNLRHELDGADLAATLGVPRNQAHALASRARTQFETALGALLVARTGQEACPYLATILDGWDGELTVLLRKRINRHIENCDICDERKRRELSPAALLSLLPVALLPVGLRRELFRLVADRSPVAAEHRDLVVRRAVPCAGRLPGAGRRPAAGAPDVLPDRAAHRGGRGGRPGARRRRGVRGRSAGTQQPGTRRAGRHPIRRRQLVRQPAGQRIGQPGRSTEARPVHPALRGQHPGPGWQPAGRQQPGRRAQRDAEPVRVAQPLRLAVPVSVTHAAAVPGHLDGVGFRGAAQPAGRGRTVHRVVHADRGGRPGEVQHRFPGARQ